METTLQIQKEFEVLISELEKLKSINEITSSNTKAAEMIVTEIEMFIKSIQEFKIAIDTDLQQKNSQIELVLEKLSETISSFKDYTEKSVKDHSSKIEQLHEKSDFIIKENRDALHAELNQYVNISTTLKRDIQEQIDRVSQSIEKNIDTNKEALGEDLNKVFNNLSQMNDLIEKSSSSILDKILSTHTDTNNNINDKFQKLNILIEKNMSLNRRNGIILMVSAITVLGLLLTFLFR